MINDIIIVERDDNTDLRFSGVELAHVSSEKPDGPSSQRWTELTLYKTNSGKYVVQKIGVSILDGENDKHSGFVCDSTDAVVAELGFEGWLSKNLYDAAGITVIEDI